MKILKRFLAIICCLLFLTVNVSAMPVTDEWPSRDLQRKGDSNCDFAHGTLKYQYDYQSNQIQLWFQLTYDSDSTGDSNNAGVVININGLGNITVTDNVSDYNHSVYNIVELTNGDRIFNPYSKDLMLSFTVGLKNGLSSENNISMYVLDLNGERSNTYSFDIDDEVTTEATTTQKSTTTKPPKDSGDNPKKTTTTKAKTSKTTKGRTTNAKSDNASDSEDVENLSEELVEQTQEFVPTQSVKINDKKTEKNKNNRKVILIFGAAAAIIAVISGCAIGIRNKKKK